MMAAPLSLATPEPAFAVSPYSSYGDSCWQMAREVTGHRDAVFAVDWTFALPDGSRFGEPRWRTLRDASKLLLWSLHADPPPGRVPLPLRSLATHGCRIRTFVRWMAANGLTRWSELDARAIERLFAELSRRPGQHGAGLAASTGHAYVALLRAFHAQRGKVADAPSAPPPPLAELGRWRAERQWPYTPDAVAVPLLAAAIHLIGEPAEAVIAMREQAQRLHEEAIAAGHSRQCGQLRVGKYLRGCPPLEMRPGIAESFEASPLERFNHHVARIYDACFVVIAWLVGARASEILGLESGCLEWATSEHGERHAYVVGSIRKGAPGQDGLPHRWIAPEPVVRAIDVLERLSAPWREIDGRALLWLQQVSPGSALRSARLAIRTISINAINARLNDRLAPLIGLPQHQGTPWRLASHQGRKTFARFVGRRDRTGLAALSKHLGHVTRAMTDRSYVGTDFELTELVDAQAATETRAALEELLVAPRLAGKAGKALAARSPFRGRTHSGEVDGYIAELLAETDMRLGICDWGYCLYRRETSACLGSEREPNPVLRTQSTCATCANFVVSEKHRPVWEDRLARNRALLDRADLDPESRALAEARVVESSRIIAGLDSNDG